MALEQVGLDKEPCLSAAGTANDQNVFIPGILGLLGAARHGDPFRLSEEDVLGEVRVHIGDDVGRGAP